MLRAYITPSVVTRARCCCRRRCLIQDVFVILAWMLSAPLLTAEQQRHIIHHATAADPCALPGKGSNAGQMTPPANFTEGADSVGAQASVAAWLQEIEDWRTGCRAKLQLNGSVYQGALCWQPYPLRTVNAP